jgi:hypothetical protein
MPMTTRQHLASRRSSESFNFEIAGLRYVCTYSRFPDGSVSEVFLNNHRADSAADANARDSAIVASLALQHGVPIETIRSALLRDARGAASTPLGAALDAITQPQEPQS